MRLYYQYKGTNYIATIRSVKQCRSNYCWAMDIYKGSVEKKNLISGHHEKNGTSLDKLEESFHESVHNLNNQLLDFE